MDDCNETNTQFLELFSEIHQKYFVGSNLSTVHIL